MSHGSEKSPGLKRVERWLYAKGSARSAGCVLCGSCYGHGPANPMEDVPGPKSKCPPYEFYRFQRHTPKSRWLMAQRVFHGIDSITPELKEVIYACTTCLMCQELCGVRNDGYGPWEITVAVREEITEREGPLAAHRSIYEGLKQVDHPWSEPRSKRGVWAAGLGIERLADKASRTLLFAGCSANGAGRSGAMALAKLMQRAGVDFVILGDDEKCCGLHAFDLGFRREYERLKDENLSMIEAAGIEQVVIACGSCYRMWKHYGRERHVPFESSHGTEYVLGLVNSGRLRFRAERPRRVTYHDPCHLGRGCGVYDAPRALLQRMPGIELVEMERHGRWSWCCGGGGGVPEADPDLARATAADRLREASETGADVLVTSSALCQRAFRLAQESGMPVRDVLEFVAEALEV